jgi:membrane protein DedA with SNARE-associated domain
MPFAGYLSFVGTLSFWPVVFIGTAGNVVGGLAAYAIGKYGGRPFISRFGKYVLLNENHLDKAETWFQKYGEVTVFFGRMVPAVRTFVSLPAGVAEMRLGRFIVFSAIGSFIWNVAMTYAGFQLHAHWATLSDKLKPFTYVGALILLLAVVWFWLNRKRNR